MKRRHERRSTRVAEPVQVYLAPEDKARLERLMAVVGANKSDVLRQALAALESQFQRKAAPASGKAVSLPVFGGHGLQPGVDLDDSASLLDLMRSEDDPR